MDYACDIILTADLRFRRCKVEIPILILEDLPTN